MVLKGKCEKCGVEFTLDAPVTRYLKEGAEPFDTELVECVTIPDLHHRDDMGMITLTAQDDSPARPAVETDATKPANIDADPPPTQGSGIPAVERNV